MRLKHLATGFLVVITGCKTIKPGSRDNAWNAYSVNCTAKQLKYYHWPWKTSLKDFYNFMLIKHGYIINGADTISGMISISKGRSRFQHVFIEPKGYFREKDLLNYYVENGRFAGISQIRLFDDSAIHHNCYTDYFNLSERYNLKNYWRLLGSKGTINIYDDFRYDNGYESRNASITTVILVNRNGVTQIYKHGPFNSLDGALKRFINKRYKTQANSGTLHTVREMIDSILFSEFELELVGSNKPKT